MPLNKYASHIAHKCPTVLQLSLHTDPTLHTSIKICNIYLPNYCKICTSKKCGPQMLYVCHMPKLPDMHPLGKYANICATYEHTGINSVTRSAVQTTTIPVLMPTPVIMTTMQPNYISLVGHGPNQPKILHNTPHILNIGRQNLDNF